PAFWRRVAASSSACARGSSGRSGRSMEPTVALADPDDKREAAQEEPNPRWRTGAQARGRSARRSAPGRSTGSGVQRPVAHARLAWWLITLGVSWLGNGYPRHLSAWVGSCKVVSLLNPCSVALLLLSLDRACARGLSAVRNWPVGRVCRGTFRSLH